jgi:hypothetical protein
MVRLPSGTIYMILRCSSGSQPTQGYYATTSADNGATWSTPVQILATVGGPGRPAFARLDCGAMIMATRSSTAPGTGAWTFIHTSWDNGASWLSTQPRLMEPWDEAYVNGTMMYAQVVPLSANTAAVVFAVEANTTSAGVFCKTVSFGNSAAPGLVISDEVQARVIGSGEYRGLQTSPQTSFDPIQVIEPKGNYVSALGAQWRGASWPDDYFGRLTLKSYTGGSLQTITFTNNSGQVRVETASAALALYVSYTGGRTAGFYFDATSGAGVNVSSGQTFRAYVAGTEVFGANSNGWKIPDAMHTAPASATAAGTPGEIRFASDGFLYVCIAMNTWRRVQLSAW